MTASLIEALTYGSTYHGYKNPTAKPSLNYTVLEVKSFDEPIPVSTRFPPFADHIKVLNDLNICDYVENKGVKEVWIWMYHSNVVVPIESNMSGPYGDISNSYRQDDLPHCANTYTVYDYNYGRGVSEATEDHMHQIEAVLNYIDGRDITSNNQWSSLLFWGKFVGSDSSHKIIRPGCGWSHYPPNGTQDYDWQNPNYVESDCEDWKPDKSGQLHTFNCDKWNCDSLTFFKWWMQNVPGYRNGLYDNGKQLKNWWDFIGDFDAAMEKGKSLTIDIGPRLARWKQTTALPKPSAATFLTGKEMTIIGGRAYVFGGQNANTLLLTNVYFSTINTDGSLGPWAQTTPLPKPYFDHVVVTVGTNLYLITGANGSMDVYYAPILADGSVGQWIPTVPLAPSRQVFAATASGNFIYVAGGNAGGLRDFVKYTSVKLDGSLNPWMDTTPLPQRMQGHTLVATRGRLYVVAPSGEVYYAAINPSDGTVGNWAATSSLPAPAGGYSTFELNGYLYLVGGNPNSAYYAKIQSDGTLGAWQPTTSLPAVRMGTRAGAYHHFVYVVGGYDGTNFFKTVYYSPVAAKVSGSATGFQVTGVSCVNNKTGQTVNVANPALSWNCEAAGLSVNSKDSLRMTVTGGADSTAPVGGSSTGLLLSSVRCTNDTTRQAVNIETSSNPPPWNCEAAGLLVNPRDSIRMNINGGAE